MPIPALESDSPRSQHGSAPSAPKPPANFYDHKLAQIGKRVFEGSGKCATCHAPPLFTEPGWPMHTGAEIGIDDFQANRSPDRRYRTTPLKGLFVRAKGGFYHDGRFKTFGEIVDHYKEPLKLSLSEPDKAALIEYLKLLSSFRTITSAL